MKKAIRNTREFIKKIYVLLDFIVNYKKYIYKQSFYPEKKHKSSKEIYIDFLKRIIKYNVIEKNYFAFGLDIEGTDPEDYITYPEFMSLQVSYNGIHQSDRNSLDYSCLLKDKNLFETLSKKLRIPTLQSLGIYYRNEVINDSEKTSLEELLEVKNSLFLKPTDASQGANTFLIEKNNNSYFINNKESNLSDIISTLNNTKQNLLVQQKLVQHAELNRLYPNSINTMRIVTIMDKEGPVIIASFLRIGGHGSIVDNMSAGGLGVGIKEDGTLEKYGFFHGKYGTKTNIHPDTKIEFSSFRIPYYKEAIDLAKESQLKFKKYVPSVGWDICITPDGPIIVEGNGEYGPIGLQTICGGKAYVFRKYMQNRK